MQREPCPFTDSIPDVPSPYREETNDYYIDLLEAVNRTLFRTDTPAGMSTGTEYYRPFYVFDDHPETDFQMCTVPFPPELKGCLL